MHVTKRREIMINISSSIPSTKHLKGQERLDANRAIVIEEIQKMTGLFDQESFRQKITWAAWIRMGEESGGHDPLLKEMNETYSEIISELIEKIKMEKVS